MADPKSTKKGAPPPAATLSITFGVFLVIFFLISLLLKKYSPGETAQNLQETVVNVWLLLPDYAVALALRLFSFSFILSLILVIFVLVVTNRMMKARKKMNDVFYPTGKEAAKESKTIPVVVNEKWQSVIVHINSANQSDWKLAILECDIMLGEILEKMGYMQESIGEKLKVIESSDFSNIESAWEAHKIRNAIAHEGSDFMINEREAKRVVGLYEAVFQEFEYI